jgi:stringent starvation protein B
MSTQTPAPEGSPTRPYLIRALHEWCTDNGFTPYLAVLVDGTVLVPPEHVRNHEIVLNVGYEATSGLKMGNELIEFRARFGGVARDIRIPVDHVIAIYARENGQGMSFPSPVPTEAAPPTVSAAASAGAPAKGGRRLAAVSSEQAPAAQAAAADSVLSAHQWPSTSSGAKRSEPPNGQDFDRNLFDEDDEAPPSTDSVAKDEPPNSPDGSGSGGAAAPRRAQLKRVK